MERRSRRRALGRRAAISAEDAIDTVRGIRPRAALTSINVDRGRTDSWRA
jgi:hypothetical protein